MNAHTLQCLAAGPAGPIECAVDSPAQAPRGVAVLCHPHPQHGGTMDNKVVQTLARAMVQLGYTSVRFNFRGIGRSQGTWDQGQGEVDDALAVVAAQRVAGVPLVLVGPAVRSFPMPTVPADTLVVHGEQDDVVPLAAVFDWARPQSLPLTVLPGAGHFFHGQLTVLKHIVMAAWASRPAS